MTATARAPEITARAERAHDNQEFVRILLAICQPAYSNALFHATAICPYCGGLVTPVWHGRMSEPAA